MFLFVSSNNNELPLYESFEEDPSLDCVLCKQHLDNPIEFGKKITLYDVTVHHFCLVRIYFVQSNTIITFFWPFHLISIWGYVLWKDSLYIVSLAVKFKFAANRWIGWHWTYYGIRFEWNKKRSETCIQIGIYLNFSYYVWLSTTLINWLFLLMFNLTSFLS